MIDYLVFPVLIIVPVVAAMGLLERGLSTLVVTPLVVGGFAALVAVLERVRPERGEHAPLDQPARVEAGHFLFGVELGSLAGFGVTMLAADRIRAHAALPAWPASWPWLAQLLLAVLLYEGASYWQHRWFHRVPWLWPFHALHHSGGRLNLVRTGRFHCVDMMAAVFLGYLPLLLLGAADETLCLMAVLVSALGILQHANLRTRTPPWLDRLVCTPAVHRHHHSRRRHESDSNYGTSVMWFDLLFGSFAQPRPVGPDAIGIEDDHVPAGFLPQVLSPFREIARAAKEPRA